MTFGEPTYNTALRLAEMLRYVEKNCPQGISVAQLAEQLACNPRTVKRYVQHLEARLLENGEPVLKLVRRRGVPYVVAKDQVNSGDIYRYAAVYCALRHVLAVDANVVGKFAVDTLGGIKPPLEALEERIQKAFHYVPFGPKVATDQCEPGRSASRADVLDAVVTATIFKRPITFQYQRSGSLATREHTLHPYTLVMYRDGFYVLGKTSRSHITLFALERFHAIQIDKNSTFKIPRSYDPERYFEGNLGLWKSRAAPEDIYLAFSNQVVNTVKERAWPGFVGWQRHKDGREILHLKLAPNPELESWLMSWGKHVEVIAPTRLRDQVAHALRDAAKLYQND